MAPAESKELPSAVTNSPRIPAIDASIRTQVLNGRYSGHNRIWSALGLNGSAAFDPERTSAKPSNISTCAVTMFCFRCLVISTTNV